MVQKNRQARPGVTKEQIFQQTMSGEEVGAENAVANCQYGIEMCGECFGELIVSFHPPTSGSTYSATTSCKADASGLSSAGRPARAAYHWHRQY